MQLSCPKYQFEEQMRSFKVLESSIFNVLKSRSLDWVRNEILFLKQYWAKGCRQIHEINLVANVLFKIVGLFR